MKVIRFLLLIVAVIIQTGCENEPIGEMNINRDIMDEALFELVKELPQPEANSSLECIIFNYPFALFVFDENLNFIEVISIQDDAQFVNFLENLPPQYSISINFPISGTLSNGDLIEINSNDELKEAIDNCFNDALKGRCDNTLIDCSWKVTEIEGSDAAFEQAWFKVNYNGTIAFHNNEHAFFGTWVTLFIGDELYLNMDLNGDDDVERFWDKNWKVNLLNDQIIAISQNGVEVLIVKDCNIPCNNEAYQVCELEDQPGVAIFDLYDFTPCLGVPPTHDVVSAVKYQFYDTEEDAIDGVNEFPSEIYMNTENPDTIYFRNSYIETGEVLRISEIILEAVPCT